MISIVFSCTQDSELKRLTAAREAETKYIKEQNELEISKMSELATIEAEKFKQMVTSIGADTIQAISTSGPEMQVCCGVELFVFIIRNFGGQNFRHQLEISSAEKNFMGFILVDNIFCTFVIYDGQHKNFQLLGFLLT